MGRIDIRKRLRLVVRRPIRCLQHWLNAYWYAQEGAGAPISDKRVTKPRQHSPDKTATFPASLAADASALADSVDLVLAEIEKHLAHSDAHRRLPYRREDDVTADLIEVGLLFVDVFGRERGETFFSCTVVEPRIYRRVLLGPSRKHTRRDDGDDAALAT